MKRISYLISLVWICITLATISAAPEKELQVRQRLKEAKAFSDTGRHDLAARRCQEALALDPYNIAARTRLEIAIRQSADQRRLLERGAKVIRPTYPPQELRTLPGSDFFK